MGNTIIRDNNPYLWKDPTDPYAVPVSVLPEGGIYDMTTYNMTSYDFRGTASYNRIFSQKHIVNVFGGVEINSVKRNSDWSRQWGRNYEFGNIGKFDPDMFDKLSQEGSGYYDVTNGQIGRAHV